MPLMDIMTIQEQQKRLSCSTLNLEAFQGKWIALRDGKVSAHANSLSSLVNQESLEDGGSLLCIPDKNDLQTIYTA